MTTGRELDALVAEKVMGSEVVSHDWPCGPDPECGYYEAAGFIPEASWHSEKGPVLRRFQDRGWPPEKWRDSETTADVIPVPFYSTEISQAMAIWQKLRESGEWCCLQIDSDYSYVWGIKLTRADNSAKACHEPTVHLEGDERSLACLAELICVAALQAVGHKVDHRFTDLVERKRRRRLP